MSDRECTAFVCSLRALGDRQRRRCQHEGAWSCIRLCVRPRFAHRAGPSSRRSSGVLYAGKPLMEFSLRCRIIATQGLEFLWFWIVCCALARISRRQMYHACSRKPSNIHKRSLQSTYFWRRQMYYARRHLGILLYERPHSLKHRSDSISFPPPLSPSRLRRLATQHVARHRSQSSQRRRSHHGDSRHQRRAVFPCSRGRKTAEAGLDASGHRTRSFAQDPVGR